MKNNILITTQVLDVQDPLLGFFTEWVREFAKQYDHVTVICLKKGTYALPDNVKVLSLGKEQGVGRWGYVQRFFTYIWRERKNYDTVFVHMNQIYVILGGLLWRMMGKKISLWYAHGHVPFSLRIATLLTHMCFASTPSGFKLKTHKLKIVGQGIDVNFFTPIDAVRNKTPHEIDFRLLTVGRISDVKRIKESIEIVERLIAETATKNIQYNIIGIPGLGIQREYYKECVDMVKEKGLGKHIHFLGGMNQIGILPELQQTDVFLNISLTGSLDKAILEAMSVGVIVVSSNESFVKLLPPHLEWLGVRSDLSNVKETVQKIENMSNEERGIIGQDLRGIVVRDHQLAGLVGNIKRELEG